MVALGKAIGLAGAWAAAKAVSAMVAARAAATSASMSDPLPAIAGQPGDAGVLSAGTEIHGDRFRQFAAAGTAD